MATDPPDRVEVTQPYIPAIRDEQPEFAKRFNPEPPQPPGRMPGTEPVGGPQGTATALTPAPPPAAPPPAPPAPAQPAAPAAQPAAPAPPVKRKSLARRMVRRIIGPDLLRKDPPKKKRS